MWKFSIVWKEVGAKKSHLLFLKYKPEPQAENCVAVFHVSNCYLASEMYLTSSKTTNLGSRCCQVILHLISPILYLEPRWSWWPCKWKYHILFPCYYHFPQNVDFLFILVLLFSRFHSISPSQFIKCSSLTYG